MVPLVERLVAEGVTVSVDTFKPEVAGAALAAGAAIINDVSGLRDPSLADEVARAGAALVVLHTRAAPKKERFPDYGGDVVGDVRAFLAERLELARARGVDPERPGRRPGPGLRQDARRVRRRAARAGRAARARPADPAGVSRKYVLGAITGRPPADRLAGHARRRRARRRGRRGDRPRPRRGGDGRLPAHARASWPGRRNCPHFDPGDERLKWIRPADR